MIKKIIFKISGMHCTSCAMDIDGTLEDTEGVTKANTNYAKSETEVRFEEEKVQNDKIITIIKNLGYDVIPIT